MSDTIWLQRPSEDVPWGFRISGGRDYQEPIKVARVTAGSIASTGLSNGDVLLSIGNANTSCLTQGQANELIKNSGNLLQLCISKDEIHQTPTTPSSGQYHPTRLENQFSSMSVSSQNEYNRQVSHPGSHPTTPYGDYTRQSSHPGSQPTTPYSPYTPSKPRGYQSPSAATTQSYHSPTVPPGAPGYHPLANAAPPQAPPPPPPQSMYINDHSPGAAPSGRAGPKVPPKVLDKPHMPDAVMNMAAKGEQDKKPFAYAADMNEIKEHRDKVRRKPVGIPGYQNILNLPQFEEPKARPYNPNAPKGQPASPASALPPGPGEGTFRHVQYNSPIGMYSSKTAEEAFVAQTSGLVTGVSGLPGTKETKDITQSETYKMIHGLDEPKSRPKITIPAQHHGRVPRQPAPDDEMTFSGVNHPETIPSKSFHRLQSLTDNPEPEIDTTSIRPKLIAGEEEVSGYDEASIRYLGRNIPSKSFRMLQHMTGGPESAPPPQASHAPRRRPMRRHEEPKQEEKSADEIVDISYVGGNIPSRSFKILQQSIGQPDESGENKEVNQGNVRVQASPAPVQHEVKAGDTFTFPQDRRQRRRQRNREMQQQDSRQDSVSDFDEDAYLSGQVQIVSGSVNKAPPPRPKTQLSVNLGAATQPEPEEEPKLKNFDEDAFLSGRLAILSDEPKPWSPKRKDFHEKAPWEKDEEEQAQEREQLFQEEPFRRKGKVSRERAPWEKDIDDTGRQHLANLYQPKEVQREIAPWERQKAEERHFDENAFLQRPPLEEYRPEAPESEHVSNGVPFDENSFLQGKVPLVSGSEAGTPGLHSSTQYKKPSAFRERAPWEKPEDDEEGGFDEKAFLMGRVPLVSQKERSTFSKIPSRAFQRLTRSMSRETSPSPDTTSDYLSADEIDYDGSETGGRQPGDMRYKGNYIPSKTFHKLRRSMDRRSAEPENDISPAQFKTPYADDTVSNAVEDVTIEKKDPEAYLQNLKNSVQGHKIRIESQAEATDF